ncbi:MAG TPA: hypothetical protein VNX23_00535 [Bradyrhizobium sp.]|jgi:hypothetical protein|uniref:hypothetical protein n=1 Tax=Bradyrhizobium sp. TaxID=376 RepID=UPI002C1F2EC0|nr:hypothetical protein [Bradyrhizobium sp.]HXB75888.1 hypothetical protein [Bradyrhizobium sp.]
MSRFVVLFMKDVLGGNGREAEVCQSTIEIDAASEGDARELAKKKFCETQSLCDWSLHADRIRIRPADFPS